MSLLTNLVSGFVVLVAIAFTVFVNYPPPPLSPLLYQWLESGHNFTFDGHQIFYQDFNKSSLEENTIDFDGKPRVLVMIHGFPTSSLDWYKVLPYFRRKFDRIIAPDLLGFGFSDKPRSYYYSIKEQADIVEQLLLRLHVDSFHLISHDYGDTVAQELLARFNKDQHYHFTIKSACLLNGGMFPRSHIPVLGQRLLRMPIVGTVLAKWSNYYFFAWTFDKVLGSNKATDAELHDMWTQQRYNDGYRVNGDILSYIDQRFANEARWVGALSTYAKSRPLLVIYGPADPVNPTTEKDLKELVPAGRIHVLGSHVGHYPQLEDHQTVVKHYLEFIEGQKKKTKL